MSRFWFPIGQTVELPSKQPHPLGELSLTKVRPSQQRGNCSAGPPRSPEKTQINQAPGDEREKPEHHPIWCAMEATAAGM